ncbi:TPA: hypothetical protein ACKFQQ_002292 [Klebsiella variicola]|uniref:hypothetical protein n=1 Tax=Klebsiella variicola TaxID=244366 RepID=UPI0015F2C6E5|nr:hypothetical protein [Klebsiella variicola]HCA5406756.1 hypothetical protein [Klebsiella variicola]HCA5411977.1 hypothetical protein [Klebsiella variicola]HDK6252287.1 hypothetical protein [Klebsiella variicola]HDK6257724.1 hypothetical protein [Klebsiella variicola]HDU5941454.1 hypothetical protein [Klebsiella variicola]
MNKRQTIPAISAVNSIHGLTRETDAPVSSALFPRGATEEDAASMLAKGVNIIVVRLALAHVDLGASGKATQTHLGWLPDGPGLLEDLRNMNKG